MAGWRIFEYSRQTQAFQRAHRQLAGKWEYDYHVTAATENNGNPRVHRTGDGTATRAQRFGLDLANRLTSMTEDGSALSQVYRFDRWRQFLRMAIGFRHGSRYRAALQRLVAG